MQIAKNELGQDRLTMELSNGYIFSVTKRPGHEGASVMVYCPSGSAEPGGDGLSDDQIAAKLFACALRPDPKSGKEGA